MNGGTIQSEGSTAISIETRQNTDQIHILVPKDRLELATQKFEKAIHARGGWATPLGVWLSIMLTMSTATFTRAFWGLAATTWEALFAILCAASAIWLVLAIIRLLFALGVDFDDLYTDLCTSPRNRPTLTGWAKFVCETRKFLRVQ